MAGDLSHFLLPNSRLPKDVSFLVSGVEVAAHKSLLASQHQIFDKMFFEDEAGSATTTVKVEVDVSEDTFTVFLRHLYGSKLDVTELETLVEFYSLACQFAQEELREILVGKVSGLLTKESRGPCETVELRNLLVKHKMEELFHLVKESQVKAEDLDELLAIASKGDSQSKVAEDMLVRYLGTRCPSAPELAAFAASTSKELLSDKMLATILQGIHEVSIGESVVKEVDSRTAPSVKKDNFEKVVEDTDPKEEDKVDGRDILRMFFVFTKFPEKFMDPMIEMFYEEAV